MRRVLGFAQRFELGPYRLPRKPVTDSKQHPFDIGPIAGTIGERLEDDEILRRAGVEANVDEEPTGRRAVDDALLELQRAEGDIDWNPVLGPKEDRSRIVHPGTDKACSALPPGASLPETPYPSQPRTFTRETTLGNLVQLQGSTRLGESGPAVAKRRAGNRRSAPTPRVTERAMESCKGKDRIADGAARDAACEPRGRRNRRMRRRLDPSGRFRHRYRA